MWQRVQTLYLALATALIAALFFSIKAVTFGPDHEVLQEFRYVSYVPYLALVIVITLLDIIALSAYKFRVFQVRTTVLAALLALALQAWLVVDFLATRDVCVFRVSAVFPLVAVVLYILAARGIWADELMVRSSSRLRSSKKK